MTEEEKEKAVEYWKQWYNKLDIEQKRRLYKYSVNKAVAVN